MHDTALRVWWYLGAHVARRSYAPSTMTRTLMKAGSAREKTFAASEATRTLPPASAVRSFDKDICKKPATRLALLVAVTFECRELIAPRDYADALEGTRPLSVT